MATRKAFDGKSRTGYPQMRFDEEEVISAVQRRGVIRYKYSKPFFAKIQMCRVMMKKIMFVISALILSNAWAYYGAQIANGVKWYYNRVSDGNGGYTAAITYKDKNYNSYILCLI